MRPGLRLYGLLWPVASATVLVACGGGVASPGPTPPPSPTPTAAIATAPPPSVVEPPASRVAAPAAPAANVVATVPQSPLASLVTDVAPALYEPGEHGATSAPAFLTVASIDVEAALVQPVGVLADGRFEVPDARLVGWYRYGPAPGDDGVTVLAAHLNYDGVDGVFRHLDEIAPGDEVTVVAADATSWTYRVTEVRLIDKNQLPPDEVWARTGPPRLVLVTCGGRYDASRRGYEDNVVVFADSV